MAQDGLMAERLDAKKSQMMEAPMAQPQLSVRSAKARDLAHRLAQRERRSIADIVERALEAYEVQNSGRESAHSFYARLLNDHGTDIDLEAVIAEGRRPHIGVKL